MSRKISRTDINFLLDGVLLLLFVLLCVCSAILEFVFPPATRAEGWLLWSKSYNEWSRAQFGILSSMTIAVLVHIMLHWSWVCGVIENRIRGKTQRKTAPDDPSRTLWGVGLLILVINFAGFAIGAAAIMIKSP